MHAVHEYWVTHFALIEGEAFFEIFKSIDPEIQKAFSGSTGPAVGAPRNANYVQFKNACAEVVEAGMADFMLVHTLVSWVLTWFCDLSNPDNIDNKTARLRDAAKWFESQMADADERSKETLEAVHAQAHEAIQEMTSKTLMNQKMYHRICEELVAPLIALNG